MPSIPRPPAENVRAAGETIAALIDALANAWQQGHDSACQDACHTCERIHPNPYRTKVVAP